ncbi:peroxisomal sarcosine oxidase-like [Palaemon carinicauda]|uniref:peroxisomal sarcosine oxidase-like n=1 Tax=Palaemon carinicauda TaxID=392227 RepID=UPI0035B613B5
MDSVEEFDVCVVGGGVMGSCAAYSLADAGKSTVLLEQFPVPHTRGSSSGHSRITGLSDYGTPYMADIVSHGVKKWVKLLAAATTKGARSAPLLSVSNDQEVLKAKAKRMEKAGVPPRWIDVDTLNRDYKATFPSDRYAVADDSGLVLIANKCVTAAQFLFEKRGGVILDAWPVKEINAEENWVRVVGPRGVIKCTSLVLCPGPWAEQVLSPLGIHLPLKTLKTGIWYYKIKNTTLPRRNFNDLSIPNSFYYSTPELEYPGLIKFGIHEGVEVSPEEREKVDLSHLKEKVSNYLEKFFPQIESEPSIEESCMYTMTPDEEFILDHHPKHKNIVYACGFSGRGFQLAPAIGDMITAMVLGHDDIYDRTPFLSSRFSRNTSPTVSKI